MPLNDGYAILRNNKFIKINKLFSFRWPYEILMACPEVLHVGLGGKPEMKKAGIEPAFRNFAPSGTCEQRPHREHSSLD